MVEHIDCLDYYNNRKIKLKQKGLTSAQRRYQTLQVTLFNSMSSFWGSLHDGAAFFLIHFTMYEAVSGV